MPSHTGFSYSIRTWVPRTERRRTPPPVRRVTGFMRLMKRELPVITYLLFTTPCSSAVRSACARRVHGTCRCPCAGCIYDERAGSCGCPAGHHRARRARSHRPRHSWGAAYAGSCLSAYRTERTRPAWRAGGRGWLGVAHRWSIWDLSWLAPCRHQGPQRKPRPECIRRMRVEVWGAHRADCTMAQRTRQMCGNRW